MITIDNTTNQFRAVLSWLAAAANKLQIIYLKNKSIKMSRKYLFK